MNARDEDPVRTVTLTKQTGNGRVGLVDLDGESDSDSEDSDYHPGGKASRKWNGKAEHTLIKRWVTGENAEMEPEDIDRK